MSEVAMIGDGFLRARGMSIRDAKGARRATRDGGSKHGALGHCHNSVTAAAIWCFFFPLLLKLIAWNGERYRLLFTYYNGLICKS
ncbi:hypothetical protein BHM03_00007427 [Ensete ventricosum]|nr:hypothetical protein BHM03_00007427 [Ensete ventricosum]